MSNLEIVCPNIDDLSLEEVVSYASDSPMVCKRQGRVNVVKALYKILGYNLEPDLLLALVDESEKQLMLAPAGGAKTTTANVKIILEKIYRESSLKPGKKLSGDNVLFLVYNNNNVKDVTDRHTELVSRIKNSGLKGVEYLNPMLNVSTVHAFCNMWIETYAKECNMERFELMKDESKDILMRSSVRVQIKKMNCPFDEGDVKVSNLLSVYNLMRESMLDYDTIETLDKFIDLGLDVEFVKAVFTTYDNTKRRQKRFDHTDSLTKFYELITSNPKVLENIKLNYEYMVFDESQDFTPIMMEIAKILGKDKNLVMIGDDDQMIYGFRGAASDNLLKFTEYFPNGKVFLLYTNRRCPRNIVDLASAVIGMNKKRYNKPIKSIKSNGKIEFRGYNDRRGQALSVMNLLKGMSDKEKSNTCICYRNRNSSSLIVDAMIEANLHFHVLSGVEPYSYPLFKSLLEVLRALHSGNNKKLLCKLYKVLPIPKAVMASLVGYDLENDKPVNGSMIMSLDEIDFGKYAYNQSTNNAINLLKQISRNINTAKLNEYIGMLLLQMKKYYWDSTCKFLGYDIAEDEDFTRGILKYFDVNKTFIEKYGEYERDKDDFLKDQKGKKGVALSTFHSLKGLEYDNVIIIDLQESIFPNWSWIDMKPYKEETKERLKESETRLAYVAITRAKENLYMYYSKDDPSIYVSVALSKNYTTKTASSVNTHDLNKLETFSEIDVDDEDNNGVVIMDNDSTKKIELEDVVVQKTKKEPELKNNYRESLVNRFFN